MPAVSPALAALDVSNEPVVDTGRKNQRPGVGETVARAARSRAYSREVSDAEAEGRDSDAPAQDEIRHVGTPSIARSLVIRRPTGMGAFEFVVLSKLRAAQLMRGCRPRVEGMHKATITAQLEVSAGKVTQLLPHPGGPATMGGAPIEEVAAALVKT